MNSNLVSFIHSFIHSYNPKPVHPIPASQNRPGGARKPGHTLDPKPPSVPQQCLLLPPQQPPSLTHHCLNLTPPQPPPLFFFFAFSTLPTFLNSSLEAQVDASSPNPLQVPEIFQSTDISSGSSQKKTLIWLIGAFFFFGNGRFTVDECFL